MARTQKTFSLLLIMILVMTEALPLFAYEEGIVNSLDVLPSVQAEKSILELKNDYEQEEVQTFARSIGVEEDSYSLIAAREEYTPLTPTIGSGMNLGFFINPFQQAPSIMDTTTSGGGGFFGNIGEKKYKKSGIFSGGRVKNFRINTGATLGNEEDGIFQKIKTKAEFQTGTMIQSGTGSDIDPSLVGLYTADLSVETKAKTYHTKKINKKGPKNKSPLSVDPTTFEFGIPGTHLIFSKPVKLEIATPNFSDGIIVDIAVMHAGESGFGSGGLSVNPDTLCNTDGTASKPGTEATVQGGKVTFYTCGASSFTMNPVGGTAGSNDVRLIIGDYGQAQVYYNGLIQVYGANPPATGAGGPSIYPRLNIGTTSIGNGGTAWTTATTTGSQIGNTYTAKTTLSRLQGGLTYTVIIDWVYTAPDKFFTWTYTITVPTGNTQNIRFYMGMDSAVAGADANDVGYYTTTPSQTVGVYDNVANVLSAQRYVSGATWAGYFAGPYGTSTSTITSNANYPNTIQGTAGDLGYGINWNFGTTPGTYTSTTEWRLLPYVSTNVPDLIPGIGQPEGPLAVNTISQMPITITNAGNATSSGMHTLSLTLPTGMGGPTSSFVDNGWTCGAQSGTTVSCNKITDIASLSGDTVRIPVIPAISVQGQILTFTSNISGGGDANLTNNSATVQLQVAIASAPPKAPGGFTGSHVWLRADNIALSDGASVASWSNSGSNTTPATQTTLSKQPKLLKKTTTNLVDNINFNPVVALNGSTQNLVISGGILKGAYHTNASMYVVGIQDNINTANHFIQETTISNQACPRLSAHIPWTDGNVYWDAGDCTTSRISTPWGGTIKVPYIVSMNKNTGTTPGGNKADIRRNGRQIVSSVTTAGFTGSNSPLYIGSANGTTNFYSGRIAEIILTVGTGSITSVQQNRIESYLALKYGITLDQTTAQNYIFSNGSVVWNAATMGTVNKDIAGIGRDDTSGLSQQKSQSINNTGDIIVATQSSIGTNLAALMWSNDGSATGSFTTTDVPSGYQRIARKWRFEENNSDVGNVVISYPANALPVGFAGTLYMLVDTDGVFAAGASPLAGIYNSSTNTYDFTTNIADGRWVSFARQPPSDTTAPTITSISIASGTLIPTGSFSLTVGYSDTGVISPSSFTGRIYAWDATGGIWSATNIAPTYMSISGTPTGTTGTLSVAGLPFGKYRFDISIADNFANTTTQSYTFFVDAPEWSISSDIYTIGDISNNLSTFGTGELIVTVKTVGAGFNLSMAPGNTLISGTSTINYWNGTLGWGYDAWNGTLYPGTILSHGSGASLATTTKSINQNGQKNTYTYRIKFGAKIDSTMSSGDYNGSVNFRLDLNY